MDIEGRIRDLGEVDMEALGRAIFALDESAWHEENYRQRAYEVHRDTHSLVLVFCEETAWPELEVKKEPAWDQLADVAVPVMHDIIGRCYPAGGAIIRAMAARLNPGGKIIPHTDSHPSFRMGHRIHVPITTSRKTRFMIDGRPYHLDVGQAYEINNQKTHSVVNKGDEGRITFIFDYVPPEQLAQVSA
ncbi:MAG: aspartyl/asparaginyl beta-hydroxylase domain-containing protein [bacterium]